MRYEPSFRRRQRRRPRATPEPSSRACTARTGDLFRRAARVAVLVFGGWLIAVLLLIVAYRFINPPFSMLMALQWLSGTAIHKQWVPLERISPNLTRAVIVAEDGRFCEHWGVDFIEAANAIRRASDGYPRGASTITMQVAKNLFLVPGQELPAQDGRDAAHLRHRAGVAEVAHPRGLPQRRRMGPRRIRGRGRGPVALRPLGCGR